MGRSTTRAVASGVTSRGANPVPPVVRTRAAVPASSRSASSMSSSLVGDDAPRGDVEPRAGEALGEEVPAQILTGARDDAVRDGQDGRPHVSSRCQSPLFPPDFSISTTCSIDEFGSSPFVMS